MRAKLVNESIEESKEDLIEKLLQTVYADDGPNYDASNEKYLESLSIDQLKRKVRDWEEAEEEESYEDDYEDDDDDDFPKVGEEDQQYSEAYFRMDKFMPDEGSQEFYDIIDNDELEEQEKAEQLANYIEENCQDEERMYSYFPKNGNLIEFAQYIIGHLS